MEQKQPATKQSWIIIVFSLIGSIFLYGVMCYFMEQGNRPPRDPSQMRPVFYVLAAGALIASNAWLHFKTYGKVGGEGRPVQLTPEEFQTQSIIALSLAEACAVFGLTLFFMGAHLPEFAIFAAGTILVDVVVILPRGLTFWSNWEKQEH